jgi:hypothetical protein
MKESGGNPPLLFSLFVESRVHIVNVFRIHFVFCKSQSFTETLEVNNFPGPEKFDDVADVRVVGEAEDIVVGYAGFLLWCNHESATWG